MSILLALFYNLEIIKPSLKALHGHHLIFEGPNRETTHLVIREGSQRSGMLKIRPKSRPDVTTTRNCEITSYMAT